MPYTLKYLEKEHVVLIKNIGELDFDDYKRQGQEAVDLASSHDAHSFISDCTLLKNKASVAEIFDFPELFEKLSPARDNKLAVLIKKDDPDMDNYHFFEDILTNRGRRVKLFAAYDEALNWVCQDISN